MGRRVEVVAVGVQVSSVEMEEVAVVSVAVQGSSLQMEEVAVVCDQGHIDLTVIRTRPGSVSSLAWMTGRW